MLSEKAETTEFLFEKLVNDYKIMVVNTCYGFVHCHHDAEDVAQEVFIDIWKNIYNFRGDSKLSTWIYRIAVNKSLNYLKHKKRKSVFLSLNSITDVLWHHNIELSEDCKDFKERRIVEIHKAIDSLSEKQKSVFVLFYYEGLSYKEIADITGMSRNSVESLLFRARTNIKKKISRL